jgi:RNA 3'-terminal phosphate cyclase
MPGDEIRRLIPSGAEEVFEVLDPAYFEVGVGNMGAHYQVKVRRQGSYPKGSGGNYFNVSGPNARVNFQSQDSSQNIVSDRSVFGDLKAAVSGIKDQDTRESLLRLVSDMETKADDRGAFTKAYQAFITSAANHMTIIAPLLPALSSFLG